MAFVSQMGCIVSWRLFRFEQFIFYCLNSITQTYINEGTIDVLLYPLRCTNCLSTIIDIAFFINLKCVCCSIALQRNRIIYFSSVVTLL